MDLSHYYLLVWAARIENFLNHPLKTSPFLFFFKVSFGIMIFTPKSRLLPKIVGISFDLTIHQDDMNVLFKKTINFVFSWWMTKLKQKPKILGTSES